MTVVTLRSLNESGIEEFRRFLAEARAGATAPAPTQLLGSVAHSEELKPSVQVDAARAFATKLEFGLYLEDVLEPVWSKRAIDAERGLWSALGLLHFDAICPPRDGTRRVFADDHYILSHDWQRHYRHKVRTPFAVTRLHRQHARIVLGGAPDTHGEATEQLLSRQQIYTNVPLFQALDLLYVTPTGALKRGAGGKGGGSLRRLGKVLRQYDLTYDLRALTPAEICALLPKEFEKFKAN